MGVGVVVGGGACKPSFFQAQRLLLEDSEETIPLPCKNKTKPISNSNEPTHHHHLSHSWYVCDSKFRIFIKCNFSRYTPLLIDCLEMGLNLVHPIDRRSDIQHSNLVVGTKSIHEIHPLIEAQHDLDTQS